MLFKKCITRKPELFEFNYKLPEFKNIYELTVENGTTDAIMTAYEKASEIADGFDAVRINLNGNKYEICEPLVFDRKSNLPVIFASAEISGGKTFKGGFTEYKNGVYERKVDAEGFRQLYVDGNLCVRSCYPKRTGNYKDEYIKSKWLDKDCAIEMPCEVQDASEIVVVEKWTCSIAKIKSSKTEKGKTVFYLDDESAYLFFDEQRSTKLPNPMCRAENSLSLLSGENEWYFDRDTKALYYKPLNGKDVNEIEFTVPVAERLIEVRHSNIYFENISFGYSNWDYPSNHSFAETQGTRYRAKVGDSSALYAPESAVSVYADNVHFDKCKIYNTGGAGITLYEGGDFSITDCAVTMTGAGGITVGSFDEKIPPQQNIVIANNTVKGIGKSYLGGVAIIAGYTQNLVIDHNTVEDCGYTGISVGWGWGRETDMENFTITNNHVSNVINNYLFDGAGLYLLGCQKSERRNLISGNYFEGGNGYAGLYFDEYSNNYDAHDNVIMKGNKDGWFLLMHDVNFGLHNISVEHNIIETKKKYINSYRFKDGADRAYYKKSKPKKRNVFVMNNYTSKYENFVKVREAIIRNSGAK